ncbi:MAG: hypothetical protein IAG13_08865 [Deltaproteobacteria bacterium]|nr:hypothetical protein [Nannocystaceae bacterium]
MRRSFALAPLSPLILAACGFDSGGLGGGGSQGDGAELGSSSDTAAPNTTTPSGTSTAEPSSDASSAAELSTASSESSGTPPAESSSGSTAADEDSRTGAPEPCLDVLWVSNFEDPSGTTDGPLVERLDSLGYEITFVRDDLAVSSDADGRCAVLISAVSDSADVGAEFYDTTTPVVTWEYGLFEAMGFGMGHGQDGEFDIVVVDDGELAAELSGVQTLYSEVGRINWAMIDNGQVIATRNDGSGHATMFAYEPGATLENGSPAAGARVALPFSNVPGGTLREPALALFEAAVDWAAAH